MIKVVLLSNPDTYDTAHVIKQKKEVEIHLYLLLSIHDDTLIMIPQMDY